MDRATAIHKIKRCLALSASSNANEAATALRQAQKLMEAYGLTHADVGGVELAEREWVLPWKVKTLSTWQSGFLAVVQEAMGVKCLIRSVRYRQPSGRTRRLMTATFIGPFARVEVAEYAAQVMWRAMKGDWRRYRDERVAAADAAEKQAVEMIVGRRRWHLYSVVDPARRPGKGARSSYYLGWISSVYRALESLVVSDAESAALAARLDGVKKAAEPRETKVKDPRSASDGAHAGQKFRIHRPVGAERVGIEHQPTTTEEKK